MKNMKESSTGQSLILVNPPAYPNEFSPKGQKRANGDKILDLMSITPYPSMFKTFLGPFPDIDCYDGDDEGNDNCFSRPALLP